MNNNIKSLYLHNIGDMRLHMEEPPTPSPGEALLQVASVGICGSDIRWFEEGGIGDAQLPKPLVLGHEFSGQILTGSRKGERVAVDPAIPCMHCSFCSQGHPNLCESIKFAGHGDQDGALREMVTWSEDQLFTIPDNISMSAGAMLEPLGVALFAVELAKIKVGMRVGVLGCGPIGLLTIQILRLAGATQIVATDKLHHRIDAAKEFGATHVVPIHDGLEAENILSITKGEGLNVCIEAAGENDAVETAIESARPGGRVILVGIPADDNTSFKASSARRKGLTIKLCRRMKHTYPRSIQLVASGRIDVESLVTHRFTMNEYEIAFATAARRDGLKVMIEPSI
jgi:L-iditol 2-dehydrogenase